MKLEKIAPIILGSVICLIYLIFLSITLIKLKSLPTCLYGCDYYYEQGVIYNLVRSNFLNFGKSSTHIGFVPATLPFFYIFPAIVSLTLNLTPFISEEILSILLVPVSFILYFLLFTKLFRDRYVSILGATISLPFSVFPIFKATSFSIVFSVPLLLLSLVRFLKEKNIRNAILLGVIMGICGLSHQALFFSSMILIVLSFIFSFFLKIEEGKVILKFERKDIFFLLVTVSIGFLISLIFWFKPLFVFYGRTVAYGYLTPDFNQFNVYFDFLLNSFKKLFFDTSSIYKFIISFLSFFGLVTLLVKRNKFLVMFLVLLMVCIYNYLIITPLTGKHFSPGHNLRFFGSTINGILVGYLVNLLKKYFKKIMFLFVIFLLITASVYGNIMLFNNKVKSNRFFIQGYKKLPNVYISLQKFLLENTSINDVVLTTNELCFVLNGLSGIKCMLYRRGHSSQFDDLDRIYLDAAIILYGNDTNKKLELIKKYNISYLYWDVNWISTEYYFDNQGRITGWFDPITILYTPEREAELKKYNISYFIQETWLDPAFRSDKFKKFKIIFVSPQNYRSFERPWKEDLDKYLEEVWNYSEDGQTIARLWKINSR